MVNSRDYVRIVENKDTRQTTTDPRTIQQVQTKKQKTKVTNVSIAASTLDTLLKRRKRKDCHVC